MKNQVSVRKIEHKGNTWLGVDFPFDRPTVDLIRMIEGSRWTSTHKLWLIPFDRASLNALRSIFYKIRFLDEESSLLSDAYEFEKKNLVDKFLVAENRKEHLSNEKAEVSKKEGYIYMKVDPCNKEDRSFLAGLEFSRNYIDSGYWKIKESEAVRAELKAHFKGRVQNY